MTRELKDLPTEAKTCAAFLCRVRHGRQSMQPTCEQCIADILRLVDASPSETTGDTIEAWQLFDRDGNSCAHRPEVQQRVAELKCQEFNATPELAHKAPYTVRPLYSAPPAGDGVPEVRSEDVEAAGFMRDMAEADKEADEAARWARIYAALSYCATRQGGGNG